MEEKERYTIESFEIEEPSFIFDNKTNQIILTLVDYNYDEITHLEDLLNQQYKEIEDLKYKVHLLNEQSQNNYERYIQEIKKNQQLKQELHDLPNRIVEEIRLNLSENVDMYFEVRESTSPHCPNAKYNWFNYVRFNNFVGTILKKYGGENE